MAVRETVFGSKSEERGFRSIEHTWGDDYRLFPQFPFSALFAPDRSIKDTTNFFYKTSVDYLLCTRKGKPLLAIDFDGLGQGFNKDGLYVQVAKTPRDPQRKLKFDFKLRIAKQNSFPYYIVGSEEFERIAKGIQLTVVDGMIGSVLAKIQFGEQAQATIDDLEGEIADLRPDYLQDVIESRLVWLEANLYHRFSPILQETSKIRFELTAGQPGKWLWGSKFMSRPDQSDAKSPFNWIGFEFTIRDTPLGSVSANAWVRNWENYSVLIVQDTAELVAWIKLSRLLNQ